MRPCPITKSPQMLRMGSVSGFSLIEIVIVLGLIGIIMTFAMTMAGSAGAEKALREPASEIEGMARQAKFLASAQRIPYELKIRGFEVMLQPMGGVDAVAQKVADAGMEPIVRSYAFPEGLVFKVKSWNGQWRMLKGDEEMKWKFLPTGLVEPLSFRYELEGNWLEQMHHPLTAGIKEESFEIR